MRERADHECLESFDALPDGLDVAFVPFADHTFTPLVSQELLLGTTMQWIDSTHAAR